MEEPTHRQHLFLESILQNGGSIVTTEKEDLKTHYELTRMGYLRNLMIMPSGWKFVLTDEAEKYLESFVK